MIETLLRALDLRTGRFTSPHLERMSERISIDGEPLDDEAFVRAFNDVAPYTHLVDAEQDHPLSFFETIVGMAYAAFADAPVDVAVVEVGMGGSWDATNVIDADVAVVLPIAVDHAKYLGDDAVTIAAEKAGIIKPGSVVVLAEQTPEVAAVLLERAAEVGATIAREGMEFGVVARTPAVGGQVVSLQGLRARYDDVFLPLYGAHQAQNAAVALAAVEAFAGTGVLDDEVVRAAFAEVTSPGRLEIIRRSPTILLDAAHNPHGAEAAAAALEDSFSFSPLVGVMGVMEDKDHEGLLAAFEPLPRAPRVHPELHPALHVGRRARPRRRRGLRRGPRQRRARPGRRDRPGRDARRGGGGHQRLDRRRCGARHRLGRHRGRGPLPAEGPPMSDQAPSPADDPVPTNTERSPRRGMAAAVLSLEAITLGLTTPVMITIADVPAGTAVAVGLGLAVVCLLLAGMLRAEWAYVAGYARAGRRHRSGLRRPRDVRPRPRLRRALDGRGPARSQDRARACRRVGGVPRGAGLSLLARLPRMTDVQRSLVLVKPDGVRRGLSGEVLRRIEAKGYTLAAVELRTATPEILAEHYAEHEGKPFYGPLVEFMLSGPVLAVVIEGQRCIEGFRSLAGATDPTVAAPGTIRGDLGRDWGLAVQQNLVHGSDSEESAAREIGIWFAEPGSAERERSPRSHAAAATRATRLARVLPGTRRPAP